MSSLRVATPSAIKGRTTTVVAALAVLGGLSACNCGPDIPLAPGDTAFVLFQIVNSTSNIDADIVLTYDTPVHFGKRFATLTGLSPSGGRGITLPCPVHELALGDFDDPTEPALVLTVIGSGGDDDGGAGPGDDMAPTGTQVTVPSSAFPLSLQAGIDYECGDAVILTLVDSPSSPFLVTVLPSRIPGTGQTGPFSGPDTFQNLETFLQLTQNPPIPITP